MVLVFGFLPFISTTLGGIIALRLRHRLHPIMAFAAGLVVTTALANLLPEAHELAEGSDEVLLGALPVAGYLAFSAIDAVLHQQSWEHQHDPYQNPDVPHVHPEETRSRNPLGLLGSVGIIIHTALDGLAIGLGFQASPEVGIVISLAVLTHGFADGMNVVTLALAGGQGVKRARVVLVLDAIAPLAGVAVGSFISVSEQTLGMVLAVFAGVFIGIGAGHLLPEAQHQRPRSAPALVVLALAGAGVALAVRSIAE